MRKTFTFLLWALSSMMVLPLVSCGDDDDEAGGGDSPVATGNKLSSITVAGIPVFNVSYDSSGRISRMKMDEMEITLSYNPLTIKSRDDEDNLTLSNISTNSRGYMTEATVSELGDSWKVSLNYDSAGHLTSMTTDGDTDFFNWKDGNLMSVTYDGDDIFYTYSTLENKAGVCSPFWDPLGPYSMTGLFGKVSKNFPMTMYNPVLYDVTEFAYRLNPDGTISAEQVTIDDITMTMSYNYAGSRAGDACDVTSLQGAKNRFKSLFKRKK